MLKKIKDLFFKKNMYMDKKILVVDDCPVDRRLIEKVLMKIGVNVITAVDGVDGLEKSVEHLPHLILSDCDMPRMMGVEMLKEIKNNEKTKDIPVIFLTSVDTSENVVNCFENDADNFMCKPINTNLLKNQILDILNCKL